VGRATSGVRARAHGGEPRTGGPSGAKRRSHSTRPRSVSIATTRSDGAPTNPKARNPRYPINRSSSTGGVRARAALASSASLSFQSSANPGFRKLAAAIFPGPLTHDERCASYPAVVQSWARAVLPAVTAASATTAAALME
jgi:hypothetical protein